MNSILDIDALQDKPVEQNAKEAPQKWQKHNVADWYFVLQDTKSAMLKTIAGDPEVFTEAGCKITDTDIAKMMGKNKSHLAPSQWS